MNSKEGHQAQAYADFLQVHLKKQSEQIQPLASDIHSVQQLSLADMSEEGASLMFDTSDRGYRSKKSDLSDGSEVKGATAIDTLCGRPAWLFHFPTQRQINHYLEARRIILTIYYKDAAGRYVADTFAFSGADPVFRELVQNWKGHGHLSGHLNLTAPQGGTVARHGMDNIELPLVCRAKENDQGLMQIVHWDVDACKQATDLIQSDGVGALSPQQKAKFFCKKAK